MGGRVRGGLRGVYRSKVRGKEFTILGCTMSVYLGGYWRCNELGGSKGRCF